MEEQYEYKERNIELDREREFRLGEGKISAGISLSLGILSLLAVLAYLFPAYLTTAELRQVYDAKALQNVLKYGMYFSLFFGVLTLFLNKNKWPGLLGIACTGLAFALGGYRVPVGPVDPVKLSLGVDWLILAFLGSVIIFTTLEKLFPKYKNQVVLRPEWGLDLYYFCFNHLMISAILIYANYHVGHFSWAVSEGVQAYIQAMPIALQVALIIVAADFVLYWEHRMFHEVKPLWPIHAVHHSVESMDWLVHVGILFKCSLNGRW